MSKIAQDTINLQVKLSQDLLVCSWYREVKYGLLGIENVLRHFAPILIIVKLVEAETQVGQSDLSAAINTFWN